MIVHGIDVPRGIEPKNALDVTLTDIKGPDRVDVILTNPPFGGMEEDGIEDGFPAEMRTRETADLFLQLIIRHQLVVFGAHARQVALDGNVAKIGPVHANPVVDANRAINMQCAATLAFDEEAFGRAQGVMVELDQVITN